MVGTPETTAGDGDTPITPITPLTSRDSWS
jgi:hypothetical protein